MIFSEGNFSHFCRGGFGRNGEGLKIFAIKNVQLFPICQKNSSEAFSKKWCVVVKNNLKCHIHK